MWVYALFLPIPITSIVLGIVLKRKGEKGKKNIVIGIIGSFILFIFSLFPLIFHDISDTDYGLVNEIEQVINVNLPDSGNITTQYGLDDVNGEPFPYKYMSTIQFTDEEVSDFEKDLPLNSCWQRDMPTVYISLLPTLLTEFTDDYYLLYNIDTGEYNTYPTENRNYSFICIVYNEKRKCYVYN